MKRLNLHQNHIDSNLNTLLFGIKTQKDTKEELKILSIIDLENQRITSLSAPLKIGFDFHRDENIISILTPYELKILACGESNCSIDQMKKLIVISFEEDSHNSELEEKMKKMFWNIMESFSNEERLLFIRFSSGNMGLPAP